MLEVIVEHTGHCLQHLRIHFQSDWSVKLLSIVKLLIEKAPKLERLEVLTNTLVDNVTDLPHLKVLKVYNSSDDNKVANPLFRKLSNCGIIVDLWISGAFEFEDDPTNPPLVFNHLRHFACSLLRHDTTAENDYKMLKTLTKAFMPKIRSFCFKFSYEIREEYTSELLALLKSKKSLGRMKISAKFQDPMSFVEQVINILQTNTTPNRPAFRLAMPPFALGCKEARFLQT